MTSASNPRFPSLPVFSGLTAWLLLFAALGLHIAFMHFEGTGDVHLWLRWIHLFEEYGLRRGYELSNEVALQCYPPGTFALLGTAYSISGGVFGYLGLLKIVLLAAVIAGAMVYACWSRSVAATAMLLFATLLSPTLAYLDVLYLAPLLLSLWALQKERLEAAAFCFTVAVLMKPQPLIIAPFFLAYACHFSLGELKRTAIWLPRVGRLALGTIAPLAWCLLSVDPAAIVDSFAMALSHNALSYQGLNPNWIMQLWLYFIEGSDAKRFFMVEAPENLLLVARWIFCAAYFFVLGVFLLRRRSFEEFVWFACVGFYTYFLLNLGVHENHLFMVMVLAFVLYQANARIGLPMVSYFSIMANLNLLLFYGIEGKRIMLSGTHSIGIFSGENMVMASVIFSVINTVYGLACLWHVSRIASADSRRPFRS